MHTITSPLGVSTNPLVIQIVEDIHSRYPVLWELLERHPLTGGLHAYPHAEFMAKFPDSVPVQDMANPGTREGASGVYHVCDHSITIDSDARQIMKAAGAFGTFAKCKIWANQKLGEVFDQAALGQARYRDFYTVVTIHELGHHFSHFARDNEELHDATIMAIRFARSLDHAISGYAAQDPEEYFAECFSAYFVMPDALKECDKAAYMIIDATVRRAIP